LFGLYEIMLALDRPSKCGIEIRQSVSAWYGGYFYNDNYDDGMECLEEIRGLCKREIGDHVSVFLKRGCTEFEHKFVDSSQWEVSEKQLQVERRLEDLFVDPPKSHSQSEEMRVHIMANWIRYAYSRGDKTAESFVNGPMYPPYRTYEPGVVEE
jgi:hypothetical protein